MDDEALIEAVELAIRRRIKVDATGLSPAVASTLIVGFEDAAKDALAVARKAILGEAANLASANEDKYQNPTEYDYGAQICSREIAAELRSLANQEQLQ